MSPANALGWLGANRGEIKFVMLPYGVSAGCGNLLYVEVSARTVIEIYPVTGSIEDAISEATVLIAAKLAG